jgi:hypothetical protein
MYGAAGSAALLFNVVLWGNSATDNVHLNITSNTLYLRQILGCAKLQDLVGHNTLFWRDRMT